jgi:hypothetical protein
VLVRLSDGNEVAPGQWYADSDAIRTGIPI